jgi:hypothetical protein
MLRLARVELANLCLVVQKSFTGLSESGRRVCRCPRLFDTCVVWSACGRRPFQARDALISCSSCPHHLAPYYSTGMAFVPPGLMIAFAQYADYKVGSHTNTTMLPSVQAPPARPHAFDKEPCRSSTCADRPLRAQRLRLQRWAGKSQNCSR